VPQFWTKFVSWISLVLEFIMKIVWKRNKLWYVRIDIDIRIYTAATFLPFCHLENCKNCGNNYTVCVSFVSITTIRIIFHSIRYLPNYERVYLEKRAGTHVDLHVKQYIVTCPGFRDKKWMGCELDEYIYWTTCLQPLFQWLRNSVFQTMRPD
jgi:hypothetical protein